MDRRKTVSLVTALVVLFILLFGGTTILQGASGEYTWIEFPHSGELNSKATYVYAVGGYHSEDSGCPSWGTADNSQSRFIGDSMGELVITYEDGTDTTVPLVFGYTMWFYQTWQEESLPFRTENADPELKEALQSALCLLGGYEGAETCVFRVKTNGKIIKNISIKDNPDKDGTPIFKGVFLADSDAGTLSVGDFSFKADDKFFDTHTINADEPYPESVQNNLQKINRALMTYEEDYENAPVFEYPADAAGSRVYFTGSNIADIATGVVYYNLKNLVERVDEDGFLHTSYKNALTWRYQGFGFWLAAGSYYDFFYSRDGGRGIMSLNTFGYTTEARSSADYANKCMMYFPENNVTFQGLSVPGHYTVMVNKPMHYSTYLVPYAYWPTRYTEEKFGADYQNLGNQETDGHGLIMMANYTVWKNQGSSAEGVNNNWQYIKEGVDWIQWCFDNKNISFARTGVLYAESEAGMNDYTLYCNVPCYLGVLCYAEMAQAAGKTEENIAWLELAAEMKTGIEEFFLSNTTNAWYSNRFGFYHDPVITMMSDIYGYDTADMDQAWVEISKNTYASDIASVAEYGYYGTKGVGYDHCMITQNALLLDQMADASKLIENLTKLSYAPNLPEPYLVPEGFTVDTEKGVIRRQGDLGNLVQLSEAMKCYAITMGVSQVNNKTLKIMPRLPEGWNLDLQDFDLQNAQGQVDMLVSYPENGTQTAQITLEKTEGVENVRFRFGPLPIDTAVAAVQVNGENQPCELVFSGDSAWVWVTLSVIEEEQKLALVYADSVENIPDWPTSWETHKPSQTVMSEQTGNIGTVIAIVVVSVCAVAAVVISVIVIKKKREER